MKTEAASNVNGFNVRDLSIAVVLAVAVLIVFSNSLSGEFVYDDHRQFLRNPLIQDISRAGEALSSDVWAFKGDGSAPASNYWRPVFTAWSILNYQVFGREPFGWHLANVLLHLLASLIAFAFARRIGLGTFAAGAAALIFAVHPVHAESVAWISGSPDPLFSFFLLGSLFFAANIGARYSAGDLVPAVLCYALAVGSKEVALFCLPLFFLLFYFRAAEEAGTPRTSALRALVPFAPFVLVAAVYVIVRQLIIPSGTLETAGSPDIYSAVISAPSVFFFYFKQAVFPFTLAINYPLRPLESMSLAGFVFPLAGLVVFLAALAYLSYKKRQAAAGAALFVLALLPVLNISAFPADQIVHDRYLYLPLFGLLLVGAASLEDLLSGMRPVSRDLLFAVLGIALAIPLSMQTYLYNRVWQNDLSLWERAVEVDPGSASSFAQLGSALEQEKRYSEAVIAFNRSLDIKPGALAYLGRGRANLFQGRYEEALWDLQTVSEFPLDSVSAYTLYQVYEALAMAYDGNGEPEKAETALKNAIEKLPIYRASLSSKLAVVLYKQEKKKEALDLLESVLPQARVELLPESKTAIYRLGALYAETGRKEEARQALAEYLRLTASSADPQTLKDREASLSILERLSSPSS